MPAFIRNNLVTLASFAIAITASVPATMGFMAETSFAATLSQDFIATSLSDQARTAPIAQPLGEPAVPALATSAVLSDDDDQATAGTAPRAGRPEQVADKTIDDETECMAKVVHHEAGNQSREGKLAVAQLMINRMNSGRFPATICGVANQPGQFFHTASYNPRHDSRWDDAVDVAREARAGSTASVVPGAMFYHAAYQAAPRFFRTRQRVMTLGDHIFYR